MREKLSKTALIASDELVGRRANARECNWAEFQLPSSLCKSLVTIRRVHQLPDVRNDRTLFNVCGEGIPLELHIERRCVLMKDELGA